MGQAILLAAVALFFTSSILCALASSMGMLLVGRAMQGAAGGGLIQLTLITLSDLFSLRFI
jgi:predicted MFS family arabinose efflux permease